MSALNPTELTAATVIERIESGEYARDVAITIARGFLPLPQDDLISVLAFLAGTTDAELATLAKTSLAEIPTRTILHLATNESASPAHLTMLMRATEDVAVLESLIRNRAVPDSAIIDLARQHGDPAVQEVIVINQARIIKTPEILDALLANPKLSTDARRRALENREEFFEKKARQAADLPEEEVAEDLPTFKIADLLEKAAEEDQSAAESAPIELSETEQADPKKLSVYQKILLMSVSEKVQLAFKGGKTERTILLRDRNRLVCSAAVRNPRMNDSEVESLAGMRNIDDEVLRLIGANRNWMSKYNIMIALARNPKVPIGVVLPLINRLTLRDLKGLKDDKGVSETVRQLARKLFQQRSQKA